MTKAKATLDEINSITAELIQMGVSDDQNFAIMKKTSSDLISISFNMSASFAGSLKNIPYREIYNSMKSERNFNVSLADGGLLQFFYLFRGEIVVNHRLGFFPSPDLSEYQNEPEIYEEDAIYAEIVARNIVATPIRFDFDAEGFVEDDHPISHLTIGQYKNCRIPVSSAISPFRFTEFILKSFYNTAYRDLSASIFDKNILHPKSITRKEALRIHINLSFE